MAKKINNLAEVKVYINGKEQAKRDLDELKKKAEEYKNAIDASKKSIAESSEKLAAARDRANAAPEGSERRSQAVKEMLDAQTAVDKEEKNLKMLQDENKKLGKVIRETEKFAKDIAEDLENLSGQRIKRLNEMRRQIEAIRNSLNPEEDKDGTFLAFLNDAFNRIVETIKNKKGELIEFSDIMDDLANIDDTSLAKAEQRLRSLLAATDKDDVERIKQLKDELSQVTGKRQRRVGVEALDVQKQVKSGTWKGTIEDTQKAIELQKQYQKQLDSTDAKGIKEVEETIEGLNKKMIQAQKDNALEVLTENLNDSSTLQIKQAVDILTQYRETLKPLSSEWKKVNAAIEEGKEKLKSLVDQTKLQAMTSQYKDLGDLSKSALSEQKKYWQEMVDGAAAGSKELATYESRLKKVTAEEQKRTKEQAGKVMINLSNYSVNEIKEAIKATEQLRDAQKPGSKAWAEYAAQVKNAGDYLDSFKNKAQLEAINTQFKDLGKLSADALAEQKKYWQSMISGATNGSKELEQYRKKLAEVTAEEQKRNAASVKNVMTNPAKYSVNEIKEAIKVTEQLRDAQVPGSKAWKDYAAQVTNANAVLDKFKDNAKMESMTTQFRNLNTLSKSALSEQKKFWQAMADGAAAGSKELELYERRLKLVLNQERLRTGEQGRELAKSVLSGSWTGTVGEAKEAVKVLKDYKDTLSTTDTAGLKRVDKAIAELTNKTKIAEAGFKSTNEALKTLSRQTKNLGQGNWKGSISELEEMRRKLIAIRDTQDKVLNPEERNKLEKSLSNVNKELAILKGEAVDVNYVLDNLKNTPLWKLEKAAKQLQEEIRECSENTGDFAKKAVELRQVNAQVEKLKKQFKDTDNVIVRTAKRLASYVLVYAGFNYVKDRIQEVVQANLQLSDSIADVEKTTGLSAEKLALLGEEIRAIDTRTTQEQLYQLAAAAGQLGLKSETDIAGFVRAANMITVSLNELGTEATTQLMKIATLTGEVQNGTEKALLSIGSTINELTANSAAAAGPIVDLMNRMGGVAAQSRLTSAEMAAIGATADALGQSMEITGTSMNKFLTTLMSDTDQIAYALNMDAKALRSLVNEGKTMDAVISIFERMNDMGGLGELAGVMGDLGSEGARMTQVLAAMASRVDFLKGQVELSTEAYNKATSIQDEYNVKNENAIAILQRMGNAVKEVFVSNVVVDGITAVLRAVYNFGLELKTISETAQATTAVIGALTAALIANRVAWIQNAQARTAAFWSLNLQDKLTWLKLVMLDYTRAIWTNIKALGSWTVSLFTTRKAIDAVSTAWKGFTKFLSTNWITITIAALGALAAWLIKVKTYVSETAKATARYNRELQEETDKVDTLFNSLKRLNSKEADRAKTINTINQQYSQYLGFMLDEKDSAEKLAAAHQLINAELRKRMALNLRTTLEGTANNAYAEQLEKSSAGIGKAVENLKVKVNGEDQKERSVTTNEVMRLVSGIINKRVAEDTSISREQLMEEIKSAMTEAYRRTEVSNTGKKYTVEVGADLYEDIEGQIGDLIDSRVEFQKKVMLAEDQANVEMEQLTEDAIEARKNANAQIAKEIEDAKRMSAKLEQDLKSAEAEAKKYEKSDESEAAKTARTNYEQAEKALKDHYTKMVDNANDYVESTRKLMEDYNVDLTKDDKERMNEEIELYKSFANETAKLVPGIDPWGKGRDVKDWKEFKEIVTNLDTSSATALAAAYKAIKEDTALIPDNVEDFYKMYDTAIDKDLKLQTPENVAKQIHSWAEQIKNKLKTKFGRNTTLGFIFEEGNGRKRPKDEFEAALASLEAYYNDREEIVRKNALLEETTQEELDKRLQSLEQEHLSARIELRKLMLSKENSFLTTFSHAAESEYMQGIDYGKLQTQLGKLGKAMSQGLEKNLTADMVTLQKIAWEHQEEISKILIENDPVKKVALEYQQSFEKIDLFWAADELRTKEAANEKMATLLEFSAKRADLNDEDMRTQLETSKQFGNVVKTMTAEEYQAFLVLLDQYAEAATNAKRQATQKAIKNLEFGFDNSELGKQVSGQLKNLEEMETQFGDLDSSGLVLEATSFKKHKEFVEQRIALEQIKWNEMIETEKNGMNRSEVLQELMLERDKATYEARLEVMKLIMDMDANMFEESNSRIDQMQGWGAISEIDATERQRSLIYAELGLKQMRIDELIRIEEEGQNRMDIINNLRLAKQDALYKADRRLTELTMQEYQQRAQVAQEWGSAIGTGLGEMIAGTEDAGKTLVKNLATMAVQSIGQMAQMYVAKQLLLSQQNMSEAAAAMTTATTAAAEATAVGAAKTAEATAIAMATPDSVLTGGATGAAKAAVISGLIAAAVAASIAIINSLFPGAGSKATASNRKLSTGMLTYAEGNYPVLGNDGKVYDAKYEGAGMKTGIYGGGAHFGIFSEKQPEMIVDGKTTQKLILNYPYIYDAITTIAKNGRLVNAMPTFASGDYPAGMNRIAQVEAVDISGGSNEDMIQMRATMDRTNATIDRLSRLLEDGITAHLDGLETHRQQKKNERFLKRRGID